MTITRAQEKFLDKAVAISLDPLQTEAAFMARQLVQATLPHSDPGNVPVWIRRNGNLTLKIQPSYDNEGVSTGIPYGSMPRLLLFWMTTEALRTKSRRLELGRSLTEFMQELGLNPDNGSQGAKRSDARRLKDQMERLFRATISFDRTEGGATAWLDMQIAPEGMVWWDDKRPENDTLFESWIELGEKFYQAITDAPVPLDMRALKALKKSPLALDLYAWATYTTYQANKTGRARSVSWELLQKQFGSEYARLDNFQASASSALKKIQLVYPDFKVEVVKGGIEVVPSKTAITIRPSKRKKSSA